MNGLRVPLSVYDFFVYLIPGAVAALGFLALLPAPGLGSLALPASLSAVERILLAVVFIYVLGLLVQAVAKWPEASAWRDGWPSERYLREGSTKYSPELRTKIIAAAQDFFRLSSKHDNRQEIFELCYSFVTQKALNVRVEIFNTFYTLYRGLVPASLWVSVSYSFVAIEGWTQGRPASAILSSLALSLLAVGAGWLFLERMKRYGHAFADEVYRNFYAYYVTQEVSQGSRRVPRGKD